MHGRLGQAHFRTQVSKLVRLQCTLQWPVLYSSNDPTFVYPTLLQADLKKREKNERSHSEIVEKSMSRALWWDLSFVVVRLVDFMRLRCMLCLSFTRPL